MFRYCVSIGKSLIPPILRDSRKHLVGWEATPLYDVTIKDLFQTTCVRLMPHTREACSPDRGMIPQWQVAREVISLLSYTGPRGPLLLFCCCGNLDSTLQMLLSFSLVQEKKDCALLAAHQQACLDAFDKTSEETTYLKKRPVSSSIFGPGWTSS